MIFLCVLLFIFLCLVFACFFVLSYWSFVSLLWFSFLWVFSYFKKERCFLQKQIIYHRTNEIKVSNRVNWKWQISLCMRLSANMIRESKTSLLCTFLIVPLPLAHSPVPTPLCIVLIVPLPFFSPSSSLFCSYFFISSSFLFFLSFQTAPSLLVLVTEPRASIALCICSTMAF